MEIKHKAKNITSKVYWTRTSI